MNMSSGDSSHDRYGWRELRIGQVFLAMLLPPSVGVLAAARLQTWNTNGDSIKDALELALTPLAVMFVLVLYLLRPRSSREPERGTATETTSADEAGTTASMHSQQHAETALGFLGLWATVASVAILIHVASGSTGVKSTSQFFAVQLTVHTFVLLPFLAAMRSLLKDRDPPAPPFTRLAARLVDGAIIGSITFVVWRYVCDLPKQSWAFALVAALTVVAYELMTTLPGRSLGKLLFGLQIVAVDANQGRTLDGPHRGRLILRATIIGIAVFGVALTIYDASREVGDRTIAADSGTAFWLLFLPLLVGGVLILVSGVAHRDGQGFYDLLARTAVIDDSSCPSASTAGTEAARPGGPARGEDHDRNDDGPQRAQH